MSIRSFIQGRGRIKYIQMPAGSMVAAVSIPATGNIVTLQAEGQNIRYRPDGIDPTNTVGMLLEVGQCHTIDLGDNPASDIKVIQTAGGAILNIITFA